MPRRTPGGAGDPSRTNRSPLDHDHRRGRGRQRRVGRLYKQPATARRPALNERVRAVDESYAVTNAGPSGGSGSRGLPQVQHRYFQRRSPAAAEGEGISSEGRLHPVQLGSATSSGIGEPDRRRAVRDRVPGNATDSSDHCGGRSARRGSLPDGGADKLRHPSADVGSLRSRHREGVADDGQCGASTVRGQGHVDLVQRSLGCTVDHCG